MKILAETGGHVVALPHHPFEDEYRLQQLLEQYPDLVLAGTSDDEGRTIWTIGYEVGVPSGSIDLLLLDSTGHIWVVETKLAKNPEVRKQVVGQVLAYASDVATWDREDLGHVADTYLGARRDSPTTLRELLTAAKGEEEADELIDRAVERVRRGDLTALIVVDELNNVLRRLVEFVNANSRFTLLALKLETVHHAGSRLFIPTVVGATAPGRSTDGEDTENFADLLDAAPEQVKELARRLDALAAEQGWLTRIKRKSKSYHLADGKHLFWLYPKWASIILELYPLRSRGFDQAADRIQAIASEIQGRPQGPMQPGLGAENLLAHWERFVGELVPVYLEGLAD